MAAGQGELDLGLHADWPGGGPLPIPSSRMSHLLLSSTVGLIWVDAADNLSRVAEDY